MTENSGENWYKCPKTGARLLRLLPDSRMEHTPVYCRKCRREHLPRIAGGRVLEADQGNH